MSPILRNLNPEGPGAKTSPKADQELLGNILRAWENDSCLEVNSVDESPACEQGVNFMSVVKRVVVTGTRNNGSPYQKSLITKNLVEDKCHQDVFKSLEIFSNEARVYKALPCLLGTEQKLVPNCFYADTELIVLEDMKPLGFSMVDRRESLDFEHTRLVLKALAEFHASSLVLEYTEPERYAEIRTEIREVIFPPEADHEGMKSMLNAVPSLIVSYLKAGATPEDDHVREMAYFEEKEDQMYHILKEIIKPKRYAVMCAGDCWITNLLFRYEEEITSDKSSEEVRRRVAEVRLLDFQGARFASVAIDILYFMHTSVSQDVIENRIEELLEIYHSKFTSKLSALPREVLKDLSIDWLRNEIKTHELYGFFMGLWVAPATTMDEKHTVDGATVASLSAENRHTPEYMKDKMSPELLTRIHDKCKYFLK